MVAGEGSSHVCGSQGFLSSGSRGLLDEFLFSALYLVAVPLCSCLGFIMKCPPQNNRSHMETRGVYVQQNALFKAEWWTFLCVSLLATPLPVISHHCVLLGKAVIPVCSPRTADREPLLHCLILFCTGSWPAWTTHDSCGHTRQSLPPPLTPSLGRGKVNCW